MDSKENICFSSCTSRSILHSFKGRKCCSKCSYEFWKSLIIDSIIASQKHSNIFIIVPTIALIDETRKRLSKFKDSYKIITHPSQSFSQRNIFILTQERAIEIIPNVNIDFFIIDEFYKLSPQKLMRKDATF